MDAKLLQTRLVEDELGRLIEGTQVALPKQVLKTSSRTKKRDRKGKGKEVGVAGAEGAAVEGGLGGSGEGESTVGAGGVDGSSMDGVVVGGAVGSSLGGSSGIEAAAPAVAPFIPPALTVPMEDVPDLPMGPTAAALVAQADAEGLGVVNYRRRRGRG